MSKWRQHLLTRTTKDNTIEVIICWLEVDKRVKEGSIISLDGEQIRWTVTKIFNGCHIQNQPNQKWGLNLPKSQRTER